MLQKSTKERFEDYAEVKECFNFVKEILEDQKIEVELTSTTFINDLAAN